MVPTSGIKPQENFKTKRYPMNKSDFIKKVAEKTGIPVTTTKLTVEAALTAIVDALSKGKNNPREDVSLSGFGSFKAIERKARMGKNPSTGEVIKIQAKHIIKFVPSSALKDAVA